MEDVKVNVKTKLSALWIAAMFCYLYADVLAFFAPGTLEELIAGNAGGIPIDDFFLLASALFMIPPIVMIFLSLVLEVRVNRWVNIVVGTIYTLIALFMVISAASVGSVGYLVYGSVEAVLTALVVWFAWKWPT
jgi:hypothetical protein